MQDRLAARLQGPLRGSLTTPSGWWRAFRLMDIEMCDRLGDGEPFGLDIVVSIERPEYWLGSRLKGLLDGLVAAISSHDGSSREVLEPRLDDLLKSTNWDLLTDDSQSLLPRRRLIRSHGRGLAWNPADEHCSNLNVRLERGSPEVSVTVVRSGVTGA
jgi:hypothetical protein